MQKKKKALVCEKIGHLNDNNEKVCLGEKDREGKKKKTSDVSNEQVRMV